MGDSFKAKIKWISKANGGRISGIPFGNKYAPIIVVKNSAFDTNNSWSIFVETEEVCSDLETISKLTYLSDNAPKNLFLNTEFELYEGAKLVATGIIIEDYTR